MTSDNRSAAEQLAHARLLDTGAQAAIYEWGPGRVLRLLPADASLEQLEQEATVMRAAYDAGVPVPAVFDVFEIDGCPAMVMQRIDGGSMGDAIVARPWRALRLTARFAELHAALHEQHAPEGIERTHDAVARRYARLPAERDPLRRYGEQILETLAPGESLLHGDFHPLNLLMGADGPVVIDWPNATAGPPEADVAMTSVLIEVGTPPNGMPIVLGLLGLVRRRVFIPRYLARYGSVRPLDRALVDRWRVVCAIQRLAAGPANEKAALVAMLREMGAPL